MNTKIRSFTFCLTACIGGISFLGQVAHGAVIMVSPEQSVQAAINGASSGDEIVLQAGSYDEDLNITGKSLTLRAFSLPWSVTSVSVSGASGKSSFLDCQILQDINSSSSPLEMKNVNIGGSVNISGASLNISNSIITGSVNVDQGNLRVFKSRIDNFLSINHKTDIGGQNTEALILQSTIGKKLTCKSANSFIGYNTIRYSYIEGDSNIIGNTFDGRDFKGIGIDVNGSETKATVGNNLITSFKTSTTSSLSDVCIGVRIQGNAKADIINNIIRDNYDAHGGGTNNRVGMGIYVASTSGTKIFGNIIYNCYSGGIPSGGVGNRLVWAPTQGVFLNNNILWKNSNHVNGNLVGGGVQKFDCINSDPKLNNDRTLKVDSPCIDAGPPDPQYNDRDGSRNDIGMFGGHNFIPDGRTTNKPIVLGLDIAPIAVPTGGTVTIESTGATVK